MFGKVHKGASPDPNRCTHAHHRPQLRGGWYHYSGPLGRPCGVIRQINILTSPRRHLFPRLQAGYGLFPRLQAGYGPYGDIQCTGVRVKVVASRRVENFNFGSKNENIQIDRGSL